MKRNKIVNTTATETPTERAEPQNMREVEDPFEYFRNETQEVLINVRRLEPITEQGQHVAGHLPSLNLSPNEARDLAKTFMSRPGYGGGNYAIQHQRLKASGGYEFASSFRFRVAGPSRALELFQAQPVQQAPVAAPVSAAPAYPPPPPWYHQPPQQQPQMQPAQLMSELPRLLQGLGEFVRSQSNAPNLDVVNVIQALQRTVQGEDDFTKFRKFMEMMRTMQPQGDNGGGGMLQSIDWGSLVSAAKEIFRPTQAAPQMQVPPGPPGYNWDGQRYVRAVQANPLPTQIPNPPGLRWNGTQWVDERPADQPVEAVEEDEEGEEEEEDEDEGPITADEMEAMVVDGYAQMSEEEQTKLKAKMAKLNAMLGM